MESQKYVVEVQNLTATLQQLIFGSLVASPARIVLLFNTWLLKNRQR
jgi:hypothetical protein